MIRFIYEIAPQEAQPKPMTEMLADRVQQDRNQKIGETLKDDPRLAMHSSGMVSLKPGAGSTSLLSSDPVDRVERILSELDPALAPLSDIGPSSEAQAVTGQKTSDLLSLPSRSSHPSQIGLPPSHLFAQSGASNVISIRNLKFKSLDVEKKVPETMIVDQPAMKSGALGDDNDPVP